MTCHTSLQCCLPGGGSGPTWLSSLQHRTMENFLGEDGPIVIHILKQKEQRPRSSGMVW